MASSSSVSAAPTVLDHGPKADDANRAAAVINWPPAVAARFQQPRFLGKGIFGRVYAAWDTATEQLVAVKQLSGRTHGEFVATGPVEFAQEVSALEACRGHPNVVKLVDMVDADAACEDRFIVTEYAGRFNLKRYMHQRRLEGRPFAEAEVRDAMRQITSGVACAHRANVLHREIVPENVVVYDEDMEINTKMQKKGEKKKKKEACVKYTICGFNASERAGGPEAKDGSSQWVSSIPYHAPELFLSTTDYDERIDTWGLGCVMAELISGAGEPFLGTGSAEDVVATIESLHAVGDKRSGPLRQKFPKEMLSPAGFHVLSGLLESDPTLRLTAAAALKMPWFRRRGFGHVVRSLFGHCACQNQLLE